MNKLIVVLLAFVIQGCIQANYANRLKDLDPQKGILVLGFEAQGVPRDGGLIGLVGSPSITMEKHDYSNGELTGSVFLPYSTAIQDGYAIIELPATEDNERYALGFYKASSTSFSSYGFGCKGRQANVFSVKAGKATYIGHYKMHSFQDALTKRSWIIEENYDFEAAKSYIDRKHPELTEALQSYQMELAKIHIGSGCEGMNKP